MQFNHDIFGLRQNTQWFKNLLETDRQIKKAHAFLALPVLNDLW